MAAAQGSLTDQRTLSLPLQPRKQTPYLKRTYNARWRTRAERLSLPHTSLQQRLLTAADTAATASIVQTTETEKKD